MPATTDGRTLAACLAPRDHRVQRRGLCADPARRVAVLALGARILVSPGAPAEPGRGCHAGAAGTRVFPDGLAGRSFGRVARATADRGLDQSADLLAAAALGVRDRVYRGVRVPRRVVGVGASADAEAITQATLCLNRTPCVFCVARSKVGTCVLSWNRYGERRRL